MGHDFKFQVIPISEAVSQKVDPVEPVEEEKPVVLIVDDEPLIVDSLAAILGTVGISVLRAYDASSALEVALASPPHLLLTDVAMPGMNGIELAMAVAEAIPETKILLFSAHASSRDLTEARKAGYDFPLLTKPIHPREMLRQVSAYLQSGERTPTIRDTTPQPIFWQPSFVS